MPIIFVSIINYNGNKDTLSCLKHLEKVKVENFNLEVVVIDNGSKEPFEAKKDEFKNYKLHILKSDQNLGFSGGQNLGIKYALEKNADFVVVLNNDVLINSNLIVELLKTFELKKDAGLVSPKIYFAKGYEFHKDRYGNKDLGKVFWYAGGIMDWNNIIGSHRGVDEVDKGQYDQLIKTDFTSGCCVMIKREVFDRIGLFDEKYFLYYEDNDLCQRAKKMEFVCYYQPKAILWHINAGSSGGSGSNLQDYFITRNRFLFGFKYAKQRVKFALLREALRLLILGRALQKKAVFDYFVKNLGKGSYFK